MIRILGRLFLGAMALITGAFVVFNVWRVFHEEYKTMPALDFVLSESVTAKGVAIRSETPLEGAKNDSLSYFFTDGTHVSMEMPVAQAVSGEADIAGRMQRDALARELSDLQALANQQDSLILQAEAIPQNVYADIDSLVRSAALGDLTPAQEMRPDIISQLNRRSLAAGPVDFQPRISELQARLETLGTAPDVTDNAITAPEPGFFTKEVDGLEDKLTPEKIQSFTVADFVDYINMPENSIEPPSKPGKIVTDHHWYFAVVVYGKNVEKFSVGRKVELDFGLAGQQPFIARIDQIVTEEGNARAVVVLECTDMSESLINIRTHKVDISLNEMSGYRFPKECIRYEGDQMGVYVMKTNYIEFKPVRILYEDEKAGTVLFDPNYIIPYTRLDTSGKPMIGTDGKEEVDTVGLERYDDVIVGGFGLRDKKPVKMNPSPMLGRQEGAV